jgi:hypothetical protein
MVVGVYGLLYLYSAWKLSAAWPIIAVGLLGKVLGPIGMAISFSDDWPRRLAMICVFNDLIWWLPFGLFLVRGTVIGKWLTALAPWLCVAAHLLAMAMLAAVLRHGGAIVPGTSERAQYISAHATAWTIGWSTWMLAAASLVGFYAWWGSQLAARNVAILSVVMAAIGMVFDFSGEGLLIFPLVEQAPVAVAGASAFASVERAFTLFSAGAANGLYTLGGALLTLFTPDLPAWVRAAMWGMWLAGALMTLAAAFQHVGGMAVATAVLFPLLIVWSSWMGARWRRM